MSVNGGGGGGGSGGRASRLQQGLTALLRRRRDRSGGGGEASEDGSTTPRSDRSSVYSVSAAASAQAASARPLAVSTLCIQISEDEVLASNHRRGKSSSSGLLVPQPSQPAAAGVGESMGGEGLGAAAAAAAAAVARLAGPSGSGATAAAAPGVAAAGDGGLQVLQAPVGVAVDFNGFAYIADTGHCRVLRVRLDTGEAVVLAGGGGYGHRDGPGRKAKFACPMYVAVDARDNSLVVSDQHCLRRVASDGFVTTIAGSSTPGHVDGPAAAARFFNLRGVAVDGEGNVYCCDSSNHCVRLLHAADSMVSTFAGSPGQAGYRDGAGSEARFRNPCGVAINLQDGTVVVADAENNRLRRVDRERLVSTAAGDGVAGPAAPWTLEESALACHLNHPQGVAIDGDGNILLSDLDNRCLRMVAPSGTIATLAGGPAGGGGSSRPAGDREEEGGPPATSTFCDPQGIAVTHRGEVLVVECSANRVRVVSARLHSPHTYLAATKSTFVSDMMGLLLRGEGADVTFVVGGEELRAHRWLLASRCECFGRMLGSDCVEGRTALVEVRDCGAAGFREFLRYLYTDQLEFKGDVVLDVLLLGRKYMVGRVFQHCCSQVRRGLCGQNALALLSWADEHRVEELRPHVYRYVLQHLRHILRKYPATLAHLEVRPDLLMQLLVAQAAAEGAGGGGAAAAAAAVVVAATAAAAAAAAGGGGAEAGVLGGGSV